MADGEFTQCVLCGHSFHPGTAGGYIYCPACGRRFNPGSGLEDTAILSPPSAAGDTPGGGAAPAAGSAGPSTRASRRFGEYDIVEEIARGGMGVVYLARQRVLRRVVALKVLRSGDNASVEERERLLREAKAAAGLSHPNIVPIHEFSIHQGQPYFTMDFIEGTPLDRLLEKGPLNVREAVTIIETVARAISYAHSRGIIHRDLKPANIIVDTRGSPMITDFGLAVEQDRDGEAQQRMTMAGSVMGTIPYAPPEQAAGKIDQISERSDVYAMGAVLYEMVSGRPPFTGFTQFELMRRVINQDPMPPRQINPKVHRDVETIILKCLEKDQRRRYAGAESFADDCHSFLRGEVIAARPATVVYRMRRFVGRRPLLNFLAACVAVLLLAVWVGLDHFQALAREKEATEKEKVATEQELEAARVRAQRLAMEKEETEKLTRGDWRPEYNLVFDYDFQFEKDMEAARNRRIPWLDVDHAEFLRNPPRLSLAHSPGRGNGDGPMFGDADLGLPFAFPRDVRVTLRVRTPPENVGGLLMMLDVDRDYRHHLGSTAIRFGSPGRPGVALYRGEAIIAEEPTFVLKPDAATELVVERADDRLRAYQDGSLILDAPNPPFVFNQDTGRITLDVMDGKLEFYDVAAELRGMSPNLTTSLIETANAWSAQGRPEAALRLYINVLLEPTDPQTRLRALRGYARSLWLGLARRDRNAAGLQRPLSELQKQLVAVGRYVPGEIDFLAGLALALNPASQRDGLAALDQLTRAASTAYGAANPADHGYGDLDKLEIFFLYLRLDLLGEAAKNSEDLIAGGVIDRLRGRFGQTLGSGGQLAVLLEKVDQIMRDEGDLDVAAQLLRAAAAIAPASREASNRVRQLGRLFARKGDAERAVVLLETAERLSPDWFQPYLDQARIHFQENRPAEAARALARARAVIPQSLDLNLGMARLYLDEAPVRHQDPVRAEEAARAADASSKNLSPAALELMAMAQTRQDRLGDALENIEAALRLERTDARARLRDNIVLRLGISDGSGEQE